MFPCVQEDNPIDRHEHKLMIENDSFRLMWYDEKLERPALANWFATIVTFEGYEFKFLYFNDVCILFLIVFLFFSGVCI